MKNRQTTLYHAFIGLTLIFSAASVFFMLSFDWLRSIAYAGFMLSIWLAISFFIVIFIFRRRSKQIENAIQKNKYIVSWQYAVDEWENYVKSDYVYRKAEKNAIFIFLTIITVFVFGIFIIFIDEGKLAMTLIMFSLVALYAFMAFVVPLLFYTFHKKHPSEVIIMENGVLLDKQFHTWDFPMSKFSSAKIIKKPFPHIAIEYEFVDRTGPRSYMVHVPIPQSADAQKVVEQLIQANQ